MHTIKLNLLYLCILVLLSNSCNESVKQKNVNTTDSVITSQVNPTLDTVRRVEIINVSDEIQIEVIQNHPIEYFTKIIIKKNNIVVFDIEDTRLGIGNLLNYDKQKDSFYYMNPYYNDSIIVLATNSYSNQECIDVHLNKKNVISAFHTTYFYFINDIQDQSLIYFTEHKVDFWEHIETLAKIEKTSYSGLKMKVIKVPFENLRDSYGLFEQRIVDTVVPRELINKFKGQ